MLIGFGTTLAALVLVGVFAWNLAAPAGSFKSVDHTREVIAAFDELRAKIDGAENGQWAYFLTREKSYLAPRDAALAEVKTIFQQLNALKYN